MAKDNGHLPDVTDGIPPWVRQMRAAAQKVIKPADIEAIIQKQVELAKAGDANALKFVFEQVLGGASMKGATFVQNNYTGDQRPDKPAAARRGSPEKIELMRRRVESGLPPTHEDDGPDDDE